MFARLRTRRKRGLRGRSSCDPLRTCSGRIGVEHKVRVMKKWYAPSLLCLAVCTGSLLGCAQTSRMVSRWTGHDTRQSTLAEVDGKAAKDAKAKPRQEARLAESSKSKTPARPEAPAAGSSSAAKGDTPRIASKQDQTTPSRATAKMPSAKTPASAPGTSSASAVAAAGTGPKATSSTSPAAKKPAAPSQQDPFEIVEVHPPTLPNKSAATAQAKPAQPAPNSAGTTTQAVAQAETTTPKTTEIHAASHSSSQDDLPEWARDPAPPRTTSGRSPAANTTVDRPPTREAATASARPTSVSLVQLCPQAEGEVRDLVKQLEAADVETVKRAAHRLGRMQTAAVAAAPALTQLMEHPDGFVRIHAALALVRMQQASPAVTQTLITGLQSSDPAIRSFAAAVVAELGPQSAELVPALSSALNDRDGYVRLHVAEVLIRHADWSHQALRTLTNALEDPDENVRWLATYSLAELAPQSPEAVAALTKALQDPVLKVQVGAAYALGEIGPLAQSAQPALERAARSPYEELRTAAQTALQHLQP